MEVLVISKSFIIREAICMFFSNNFEECRVVEGNILPDILKLDLSKTEILLIDVDRDIIEYIAKVKDYYKNLKVIVYNKTNNKDIVLNCFKYKIDSCISDIQEKEDLTYIINTVKRGKKHYEFEVLEEFINNKSYNEKYDANILTNRENEVLDMVGCGYSNKEIAKTLYISEHTVKKHITNILFKLDMRNRKDLIIYKKENNIAIAN